MLIGKLCFFSNQCLAVQVVVICIIAVVKKITCLHIQLGPPFIGIIDTQCIGSTDTFLCTYLEIAGISATATTCSAWPVSTTTAVSTTTTAAKISAAPTTTGNAKQILRRKILCIDIIKVAYYRYSAVAFKCAYIASGIVPAICTIARKYAPELPILNARLGNYINCFYRVAIIKTGKCCLI